MMDLDLLPVCCGAVAVVLIGGHASGEKVKSFGREFYSFSSLFLLGVNWFLWGLEDPRMQHTDKCVPSVLALLGKLILEPRTIS
jgi:hypothetical protein